ncbi:MAG: aminoglycoside phosphotransferase family protein [SAR324 cluster bacterium]
MSLSPTAPAPPATQVEALRRFAERVAGAAMALPEAMPGGGSSRRYYRIRGAAPAPWGASAIGVITSNPAEARAFEGFTGHLLAAGIPVPRHLGHDPDAGLYLVEDLGDRTLSDRLREWRAQGTAGGSRARAALLEVVALLAKFQVRGARGLDLSLCFDGRELSGAAFRADLTLFLTHYVPRFAPRPAPGAQVAGDVERLIQRLDALPREHLCHRDFQARNIMWPAGRPVLLDYQGARFGPLAYDLASLLYSPDTGLTEEERPPLIAAYLEALAREGVVQAPEPFQRDFYAVVLVRRLQALGAYARIAAAESKPEYLQRIAPALDTLHALFRSGRLELGLPHLEAWLARALTPRGRTAP